MTQRLREEIKTAALKGLPISVLPSTAYVIGYRAGALEFAIRALEMLLADMNNHPGALVITAGTRGWIMSTLAELRGSKL